MLKTFKYRIYPTKKQELLLLKTLDICQYLYNSALTERIDFYKKTGKSMSCNHQINDLPVCKDIEPDLNLIYGQVLQDVLRRLDKSYQNFFRRVKAGLTPGFPRYKSKDRYDSFTYPQLGFSIVNGKLSLSKIGHIKIKLHRQIIGKIKTCTIRRDLDRWYVCFSVEAVPKALRRTGKAVGIDFGLTHFVTLYDSDGISKKIDNPRYLRKSEKKLKRLQCRVSSKKKGSNNRAKARFSLAKQHRKVKAQRRDFMFKFVNIVVANYDYIGIENLAVSNMVKNHCLAKSISDAAWSGGADHLLFKAAEAGKVVTKVNTFFPSSKLCSGCGFKLQRLSLDIREWVCPQCGEIHDRDTNAAKNILAAIIPQELRESTLGERGAVRPFEEPRSLCV